MIDLNFLRQNPERIKRMLKLRGVELDIDKLLELDKRKRELISQIDQLRAEQNKISSKKELSLEELEKARELKSWIKEKEGELKEKSKEFLLSFYEIPNLLLDDIPPGKEEKDNLVLRKWGRIPEFDFEVKDHLTLGKELDLIDTEKSAKIAGSRFGFLKREAVLLEFALIDFVFEVLSSEKILRRIANRIEPGYFLKKFIPIIPPVMIKPEVFFKMARLYLEDKEERYYLPKDDLYLIGSAEHTLGPLHIDEILLEQDLPIRYLGFSTCFRREAGSWGKDTRGIFRVHQFDKLEMESFVLPEYSLKEQEFLVAIQEYLMEQLGIPYQVVLICSGQMSKPDARQIDIEAWFPSQKRYRETHTTDLMTDYQARRLNTKVKRITGKIEFLHMVDATALAIGRTLIAIFENYQTKKGTIIVPKVLRKKIGIKEIKR